MSPAKATKPQDALAKLRKTKREMDAKIREAERLAGADSYARHRDDMRKRQAAKTHEGQNIAPIPKCKNPERRAEAAENFRVFCESYFPKTCFRPWSEDLRRVLNKMELTSRHAGLFAFAMPRSTGKTTLTKLLALWSILNGYHNFVMIVAANEDTAVKRLFYNLKKMLFNSELLLQDYPEVVYPILCLQNKAAKAKGQHIDGKPTNIEWSADRAVMPIVEGSLCCEAVIKAAGINSANLRGEHYDRCDGTTIRPSLVILDDPQTRETARSPMQTEERMRIINGDVMGMAESETPIAVLCPCTVIYRGDLADQLLDHEKNPAWKGEKTQLVYHWPCEEGHRKWLEYNEVRSIELLNGGDGSESNVFYKTHRDLMDRDAVVSWPECKDKGELSALQHAYNLRFRVGEEAFAAEYQNDPLETSSCAVLTANLVASKLNRLPRGSVPQKCQYVTAFVDMHKEILYWVVSAWQQDFGGGPIDYGTYPGQPLRYFAQNNPPMKMQDIHGGMVEQAWIQAGLTQCVEQLLARTFLREDGAEMRIGRLLIDAGWSTDIVKTFVRRHPQAGSIVQASFGRGIKASDAPMAKWPKKPGQLVGDHWVIEPAKSGDRAVTIDTNHWKSFAASRLASPVGTPGGWELFGSDPREHQLFADHCVAEEPVEVTAKERTVFEWKWKPGRPDNHWWDSLIGSAIAGSMLGATPQGVERPTAKPRQSLAELAAKARKIA